MFRICPTADYSQKNNNGTYKMNANFKKTMMTVVLILTVIAVDKKLGLTDKVTTALGV